MWRRGKWTGGYCRVVSLAQQGPQHCLLHFFTVIVGSTFRSSSSSRRNTRCLERTFVKLEMFKDERVLCVRIARRFVNRNHFMTNLPNSGEISEGCDLIFTAIIWCSQSTVARQMIPSTIFFSVVTLTLHYFISTKINQDNTGFFCNNAGGK